MKKNPFFLLAIFSPFPQTGCIQYQTEVTRVQLIRLWPAWQVLERKGKGVFLTQFSPQTTWKKPSGTQGTNLLSEKRFARGGKRGLIKVNALKEQQLNSFETTKQTNKSKRTLAHILLLTHQAMSSSPQSPTISTDPRRTGVFLYSPQVSLTIQN